VDNLPVDQLGLAFDFIQVFYGGAGFGAHGVYLLLCIYHSLCTGATSADEISMNIRGQVGINLIFNQEARWILISQK
jgi:hypothetical protein